MSYILEALKKSEQERNPDKVPDLTTHHQALAVEQNNGFPWPWVVVVLILVNLAVLYWFFVIRAVPAAQSTQPVSQPAAEIKSDAAIAQTSNQPEISEPISTPVRQQVKPQQASVQQPPSQPTPQPEVVVPQEIPPVVEAQPEPVVYGPPKFAQLPHISELSQGIQNQLPAIEFSTHIFVKDGGSFVIMNNRSLSDGMNIGNGIMLEKIVREGVILSFRERYFTLNSMESWQK